MYKARKSRAESSANKNFKNKSYTTWVNMRFRCYSDKCPEYHNYGGRGIIICDRWLESFDNFIFDMGDCPKGLSIDRIDVNGNYEPSNCRWATRKTQAKNRRNNVYVTIDSNVYTALEFCAAYGIIKKRFDYLYYVKKLRDKQILSVI